LLPCVNRRTLSIIAAVVATLAALPASAHAAGPGATAVGGKQAKKRCPGGTTPIVRKRGHRLVVKRDRRGRLRCRTIKAGRPPAPSAAPLGQAAGVADALREAMAIDPGAARRLDRAIGRRRAKRLLDVTLDGWRRSAGAATARAAQAPAPETQSFTPNDGVKGSATFGIEQASGPDSGFTASATASISATREGVAKLSSSAKEKLPADVKSARGELSVRFEDKVRACASAKGERTGKVKANGKVKVTVERDSGPPIVMELEADTEVTYIAKADETGQITKIDDLDVKTTFRSAATGEATQTYRGRRVGTGFGRASILDASDIGAAMERDFGHVDSEAGGVFGPKGSWNFSRGVGLSDLRTIDNVKAMFTTAVATNLLTLAALEYLRKVALPRAEKETCGYTASLSVNGQGIFATHEGSGRLAVGVTTASAGAGRWTGTSPAAWESLVFTSKIDCPYVSPVSGGTFTVDLALTDAGRLQVTWTTDAGGGMATASVDCPPQDGDPPYDPPPIPGQPGPSLVGAGPTSFELPAEGGSQPITGGVQSGGQGFFNDGVLTVTRTR
jgi:hypothetical protein